MTTIKDVIRDAVIEGVNYGKGSKILSANEIEEIDDIVDEAIQTIELRILK